MEWCNAFPVPVVTFCAIIMLVTSTYIRTSGELQTIGEELYPHRQNVMDCLGKCFRKPSCYCARLAADESSTCETLTNSLDANTLNRTGYVFYALDKYNDALEAGTIALKKPAHQSSTYSLKDILYSADKAVDGLRHVDGFTFPYIAHTDDSDGNADTFPWWQVDLKKEYVIMAVSVLNRRLWADRLHDFEIRVGNEKLTKKYSNKHFDKSPVCDIHYGSGIADNETRFYMCRPCPVTGRYVSMQIVRLCNGCSSPKLNVLQLAEVDVYGFPA